MVDGGLGLVGVAGVGRDHVDVAADLRRRRLEVGRFRDDSSTEAPASAYALAIALPMPRDAPVTSATLPSSEISTVGTVPRALAGTVR